MDIGVHLVYKYRSGSAKHRSYNEQKIEFKSDHDSARWATAVEIVDAFTGQALKSGLKINPAIPRMASLFALMSKRDCCERKTSASARRAAFRSEIEE